MNVGRGVNIAPVIAGNPYEMYSRDEAKRRLTVLKNPWLKEFLGPDFIMRFDVAEYGTVTGCLLESKDGTKRAIGTAERRYGVHDTGQVMMAEALDDAVNEAFDIFTAGMPRMDRIMRYGR